MPETATVALRSTPQIAHRLEVKRQADGTTIIDDGYNSNPAGFASALDLLPLLAGEGGRRILVTPGMVELGDAHEEEHRKIGAKAGGAVEILLAVAPERIGALIEAYKAARPDGEVVECAGFKAAQAWMGAESEVGRRRADRERPAGSLRAQAVAVIEDRGAFIRASTRLMPRAACAGDQPACRGRGDGALDEDRGGTRRHLACRRRSGPSPGPAGRRSRATSSTILGLVAGRRVLDFASGSGLVAIAAMKAGAASALAADIDSFAIEAIHLNAEANGVRVEAVSDDVLGRFDTDAEPTSCSPATSSTTATSPAR